MFQLSLRSDFHYLSSIYSDIEKSEMIDHKNKPEKKDSFDKMEEIGNWIWLKVKIQELT